MKKRIIAIAGVVIIAALLFLSIKQIFFTSYNTSFKITEEQIENRILINKITNAVYKDCFFNSASEEDAKKYITEYSRSTEYNEVVDELTRAELMNSILTTENCAVEYGEAKKNADKEYERMRTDNVSKGYYESLKKVLSELNISEEEYKKLSYDYAYDVYSETSFNAWFIKSRHYKDTQSSENLYDDKNSDMQKQVEAYLNNIMKKVEVEIVK